MPFTPLHMGPALLLKAGCERRFSLFAFGCAQILMDIEPLLGLIRHAPVLHGRTHTLLWALPIGLGAVLLARLLRCLVLRRWNREVAHYGLRWLSLPLSCGWSALLWGGLLGAYSHLLLDGLMHGDIQPLWPLYAGNPFYGWVSIARLEAFCLWSGGLGALLWLVRRWCRR